MAAEEYKLCFPIHLPSKLQMTLLTASITFNLVTFLLSSLIWALKMEEFLVWQVDGVCVCEMSSSGTHREGGDVAVEGAGVNASVSTVHDKYTHREETQPGGADRCSRQSLILLPLLCLPSFFLVSSFSSH